MRFRNKVNHFIDSIVSLCKIFKTKISYNSVVVFGRRNTFRKNSRIKIFDLKGKIVLGDDVYLGYNSEIYVWQGSVFVGNNTSFNDNCKIYGDVVIGNNCLFASNIFLSSGTHNFRFLPSLPIKRQDNLQSDISPIVVEDDCWIGFGVVIMPGVVIGKGAVVGANSVVTKNIKPYTINGGVPSKMLGVRLEFFKTVKERLP